MARNILIAIVGFLLIALVAVQKVRLEPQQQQRKTDSTSLLAATHIGNVATTAGEEVSLQTASTTSTASAASQLRSQPTVVTAKTPLDGMHFLMQRFPLVFFNLSKWMFHSSAWGLEGKHGFPFQVKGNEKSGLSNGSSAHLPTFHISDVATVVSNEKLENADHGVPIVAGVATASVISGSQTVFGEDKRFRIVCGEFAAFPQRPTAAQIENVEKDFANILGFGTVAGGPPPKGGKAKKKSGKNNNNRNGFFGENICVPLFGLVHGFGDTMGLRVRPLLMITEMGTTVRDFALSRGGIVLPRGGVDAAAATAAVPNEFSENGNSNPSTSTTEENKEGSAAAQTTTTNHSSNSSERANGKEPRESVYCAMREIPPSAHKKKRSLVVIHPVRQHFNNLYHIVLRLSATLSFMSRTAEKKRELHAFIADMSSGARHSYYSERGLISCEDQVKDLPPKLQEFQCRDCGVKMAFTLIRPAITNEKEIAYSARRNIYRKLFQAIAPQRCVTRKKIQQEHTLVDDEPWFSTVGVQHPPRAPSAEAAAKTTREGRYRNVSSNFEVEVGADIAKGIQQFQFKLARNSSSSSSSSERTQQTTMSDDGSGDAAHTLSLSSAMCFDDAIIGWDKFPMIGPFTNKMGAAFRMYRHALLAYYYPHNYFRKTIDKRKEMEGVALKRRSVTVSNKPVERKNPPRKSDNIVGERKFYDALPDELLPQCNYVPPERTIIVRVLVILRKDTRRLLNHDVVVATLKAQRTIFFPLPDSQQQKNGIAGVCTRLEISTIEPEVLTMAEQIKAAAEADIVMALNGAALTLASFQKLCYPHCTWIEIIPPTRAFGGRSGWNNNPKGTFGALMTLGRIGHHLAWKQPYQARCHVVFKKKPKNGTSATTEPSTFTDDCVTLSSNNTARPLEEFPEGMFQNSSEIPGVPGVALRHDIKVNTTALLTTMQSAVCLNAVRGRWAAKWMSKQSQMELKQQQQAAAASEESANENGADGAVEEERAETSSTNTTEQSSPPSQAPLPVAKKPAAKTGLNALCDIILP